jgi:hypothetical protein
MAEHRAGYLAGGAGGGAGRDPVIDDDRGPSGQVNLDRSRVVRGVPMHNVDNAVDQCLGEAHRLPLDFVAPPFAASASAT